MGGLIDCCGLAACLIVLAGFMVNSVDFVVSLLKCFGFIFMLDVTLLLLLWVLIWLVVIIGIWSLRVVHFA